MQVDRYLDDCDRGATAATVQGLARHLGLTVHELREICLCKTGLSPGDLLRKRQLARARDLLLDTDLTIEVIAMHCGFGTDRTLYRLFVAVEGMTPTEYRRRHTEWTPSSNPQK
ncbi:MAG: helix-turn-helix domain-containing protein [Acidobacteria bacterium]|nr:helix-turn-helix domain-containing protein [Acidobacteriota bacterium]